MCVNLSFFVAKNAKQKQRGLQVNMISIDSSASFASSWRSLRLSFSTGILKTIWILIRKTMILIAHRGESYDAPENTLAAVNLAWQRDVDALEVDVHLTKDGTMVVIHNSYILDINGELKNVKDQTLEELKQLDIGKYKGEQWKHERIPTLQEILETVPTGKTIFIEIKCRSEILPELKTVLKKSRLKPDQVKLIGFDFETMKILKSHLPQYEIYLIFDMNKDKSKNSWQPAVDYMIETADQAGANGIDVKACEAVNKSFVEKVKTANLKLYVWTVNDPVEAKQLIEAGVDGITTDRPQWLKAELNGL